MSAYFLPGFRLRRALRRIAHRGGTVELILAGKTDVAIAQTAARSIYGPLLRSGVRIWEYQPQVLHAKLAIVDQTVFVGTANLDARSLGINYELMVHLADARLAALGMVAGIRPRSIVSLPESGRPASGSRRRARSRGLPTPGRRPTRGAA
jgi:cardiolipin synthase